MKHSIARGLSAAVLMAAAILASHPVKTAAPVASYSVRFLPPLGGTNSRANSINNSDWIAGYSNLESDKYRHAALWEGNTVTDLGTLGSPLIDKNSSVAWPVKNTRGTIVGISQTDSPDPWGERWSCWPFFPAATSTGFRCVGFVWESGVMRPLPTLGGTHGYAAAANNLGQIVGWAENRTRDPQGCTAPQIFQFRAVVWGPEGDRIRELPLVPGDTSSAATAINDKGQIVGISGACDQAVGRGTAKHAVLWDGGTVTPIGDLGGKTWNTPTAINERGDIVGFSNHEGEEITEAFLWTKEGGMIGLGALNLPGHVYSEAHAVNESRQVVGLSCSDLTCRAFLWQNGVMTDLNDLVTLPPGQMLNLALDINDAGVIVGRGSQTSPGTILAYVATPAGSVASAATAPNAGSRRGAHVPDVTLSPDAMRQILAPLGPGRARLDARHPR